MASHAFQDHDHLADLGTYIYERLLAHSISAVMQLQDTFGSLPPVLTVGTACSGTDLIMATFQSLTSIFKGLNIEVRFEHVFAADINDACRRQFVMANWEPKARRAAPL